MKAIIAVGKDGNPELPFQPVAALAIHRSDADADNSAVALNAFAGANGLQKTTGSGSPTDVTFQSVFVAADVAVGDELAPAAQFYQKAP